MSYRWNLIRSKGHTAEYAIYSYNADGSFNELEDVVVLTIGESIGQYVEKTFMNECF